MRTCPPLLSITPPGKRKVRRRIENVLDAAKVMPTGRRSSHGWRARKRRSARVGILDPRGRAIRRGTRHDVERNRSRRRNSGSASPSYESREGTPGAIVAAHDSPQRPAVQHARPRLRPKSTDRPLPLPLVRQWQHDVGARHMSRFNSEGGDLLPPIDAAYTAPKAGSRRRKPIVPSVPLEVPPEAVRIEGGTARTGRPA